MADPLGDPLAALAPAGGVLAVITAVEGPHYRRPGAMMAFPAGGGAVGQLSSGCIEADLAIHAARLPMGPAQRLRYGAGSPFADLRLPCGGALEVTLVAVRDPAPLRAVLAARAARQAVLLVIDPARGDVAAGGDVAVGAIALPVLPPLRCLVCGTGIETVTFAALARAAGCEVDLRTHDAATATAAQARGMVPGPAAQAAALARAADDRTAVVLFYHDHDHEPPILAAALAGQAFYIGAQGSLRSDLARREALRALAVPEAALTRLRGPIGLISSARDPQVLAVSVLAEILAETAG